MEFAEDLASFGFVEKERMSDETGLKTRIMYFESHKAQIVSDLVDALGEYINEENHSIEELKVILEVNDEGEVNYFFVEKAKDGKIVACGLLEESVEDFIENILEVSL